MTLPVSEPDRYSYDQVHLTPIVGAGDSLFFSEHTKLEENYPLEVCLDVLIYTEM